MKLIGNFIDSSISKFTLDLFELFCIPIINNKNKHELNENIKMSFLIDSKICL